MFQHLQTTINILLHDNHVSNCSIRGLTARQEAAIHWLCYPGHCKHKVISGMKHASYLWVIGLSAGPSPSQPHPSSHDSSHSASLESSSCCVPITCFDSKTWQEYRQTGSSEILHNSSPRSQQYSCYSHLYPRDSGIRNAHLSYFWAQICRSQFLAPLLCHILDQEVLWLCRLSGDFSARYIHRHDEPKSHNYNHYLYLRIEHEQLCLAEPVLLVQISPYRLI